MNKTLPIAVLILSASLAWGQGKSLSSQYNSLAGQFNTQQEKGQADTKILKIGKDEGYTIENGKVKILKFKFIGKFIDVGGGEKRARVDYWDTTLRRSWTGYINHYRKLVIPLDYDFPQSGTGDFNSNKQAVVTYQRTGTGIINKLGKFVVTPGEYDRIYPETEGIYRVVSGTKHGFIKKDGEILGTIRFDNAGFFNEGLAAVKEGELWGYINRAGAIVIPTQYKAAQRFRQGVALVQRTNNKWGCIDKKALWKVLPKYDVLVIWKNVEVRGGIYNSPKGLKFSKTIKYDAYDLEGKKLRTSTIDAHDYDLFEEVFDWR